ncbi:MAG: glycosyltransferase [Terracidiphilus sp.]
MIALGLQTERSTDLDFRSLFGRRPRVVIGHPFFGRGGSEACAIWLCEALKQDCDLTLVTTGGWNLDGLNQYYGTSVKSGEVRVRLAPMPPLPRGVFAAALRGACFQRFARRIAGDYDIRISAYNPTDWGLPAVHFIADFCWHRGLREQLHPPTPGFVYRDTILRKAYLRLAAAYERPSGRDVLHEDAVIANSWWSAMLIQQTCGAKCASVVYPPVWTEIPFVPWKEKEEAFAMIGRIAPEKRIEEAILILEAVRAGGHGVGLHLCGEIGDDLYGRRIAQLCRERADWIVVEGRVSGERKSRILAHCRYGIQACGAEGFGISVAEMVKAGSIVFAPANGGQAEILDNPELLFTNEADAIAKIQAVLRKPEKQEQLAGRLAGRAPLFDARNFIRQARACIAATVQCPASSH